MLTRPTDPSGDILPVLSSADLLSGPEAAAVALQDHLNLFTGDWWENESRGNEVPELLALSRQTDQDAKALSSYLVSYIQSFPAVRGLSDVRAAFSGREFRFACTAHTEAGAAFPVSLGLT